MIGNLVWYEKFEKKIVVFKWMEVVLLFLSGYLVNVGVFLLLLEKEDVILSD